ncbi:aromatic prenyltransferase [Nocardia sp. NPDC003482]
MDTLTIDTRDRLRRDLRRYAEAVDCRYEPAIVEAALDAFGGAWSGIVGVRTTTHPVGVREVDARVQYPGTPAELVATLRRSGLVSFSGRPPEALLDEVIAAVPEARAAVDVALGGGVRKVWLFFPEVLEVERTLAFAHVPDSARAHAGHLTRYGGRIGILSVDFAAETMNLYSQVLEPGTIGAAGMSAITAELGFVIPTEAETHVFGGAYNVYRTFGWDSPHMRRICFPVRRTRDTFPTDLHPVLARFVAEPPFPGEGPHGFTAYVAYGPSDRYYKVQAEYSHAARAAFPGGVAPAVNR